MRRATGCADEYLRLRASGDDKRAKYSTRSHSDSPQTAFSAVPVGQEVEVLWDYGGGDDGTWCRGVVTEIHQDPPSRRKVYTWHRIRYTDGQHTYENLETKIWRKADEAAEVMTPGTRMFESRRSRTATQPPSAPPPTAPPPSADDASALVRRMLISLMWFEHATLVRKAANLKNHRIQC